MDRIVQQMLAVVQWTFSFPIVFKLFNKQLCNILDCVFLVEHFIVLCMVFSLLHNKDKILLEVINILGKLCFGLFNFS